MFAYLSKKIPIANGSTLTCLSWNVEEGWMAYGGERGLLKVIAMDHSSKGAVASNALSMDTQLRGHEGKLRLVTWNPKFGKLTSGDDRGQIIVWRKKKESKKASHEEQKKQQQQQFTEEMVNTRPSVVADLKWTPDGREICIVERGGGVILGSVDGERIWGKEFDLQLSKVAWSPDSRRLLLATTSTQVHVYDRLGQPVGRVPIAAVSTAEMPRASIVAVEWHARDGVAPRGAGGGGGGGSVSTPPALAVCLALRGGSSRVQIMRTSDDEHPVLIDTGFNAKHVKWNCAGNTLAIAGERETTSTTGAVRKVLMVQFYSQMGQHLRTLKVPGTVMNGLSWDRDGLRLAMAVDAHIYLADIRPDHQFGYFGNTLVYSFDKPGRKDSCVAFWDVKTDERHTKYVKLLQRLVAAGQHCVFATHADDRSGQFVLILCNAIGSPVASKFINVEPLFLAMTDTHVIAASHDVVHVWHYAMSLEAGAAADSAVGEAPSSPSAYPDERTFHIDDLPSAQLETGGGAAGSKRTTQDPVCSVAASDSTLVIARASGALLRYTLPRLALRNKYLVRCRPQYVALNCDSSRLSIVDIDGVLTLFDLDAKEKGQEPGKQLGFQRKAVWDVKWSKDNPLLFACMEKGRMYVFRDQKPEEPLDSSGYLCEFNDLCIRAARLDVILRDPEACDKEACIKEFETKSLRDTRELLRSTPLAEAFQFVQDNPHPRLWRIVAEAALEQLSFQVADKAFVRCKNYQGIQFTKRLQLLPDKHRQQAEVAAYFGRFEEAERLYMEMGATDLALQLRVRLGDWARVVELVQDQRGGQRGGAADTDLERTAYNNIGQYHEDRHKWTQAYRYYLKANNQERLVACAHALDDYGALVALADSLPAGTPYLGSIGHMFRRAGMCSEAVKTFLKAGAPRDAIAACVELNEWEQAVALAEKHSSGDEVRNLLAKYGSHLLQSERLLEAVELYRKANQLEDAARLLRSLAKRDASQHDNPRRAKTLHVLAALCVREQADAWHGAEAFHWYLLAQRQLYGGDVHAAMRTALRLPVYQDELDERAIYSLIALTSLHNKHYLQCSRAFIKLETLRDATEEEREGFRSLALSIFTQHKPADPEAQAGEQRQCPTVGCSQRLQEWEPECDGCGATIPACTVTGRGLFGGEGTKECARCKHPFLASQRGTLQHCPLCHAPL